MYKIICLTATALILCSIIITYSGSETFDEKLAYQMSKSENFKAIMNYGRGIAGQVEIMPDSTKNKLHALKPRIDFLLATNNKLSHSQIADSMIMISNLVKKESVFDSSFYKKAALMGLIFKKFHDEFPEYNKMSKEEKAVVFKKATSIYIKNSEI